MRAGREKTIAYKSDDTVTDRESGGRERTDLDRNERDDDLLEALGMAGGDGLLEELEHVLEDADARVQEVDPLRDLEIASCGFVERLEVGVGLPDTHARQYYACVRIQAVGRTRRGIQADKARKRKRAAAWYRRRSECGRQGDDRATSSE